LHFLNDHFREDWKPVLTVNSIVYGLQYLFLVSKSHSIYLYYAFWQQNDLPMLTVKRQASLHFCIGNRQKRSRTKAFSSKNVKADKSPPVKMTRQTTALLWKWLGGQKPSHEINTATFVHLVVFGWEGFCPGGLLSYTPFVHSDQLYTIVCSVFSCFSSVKSP
jgi:hypothetical protein